MTDTLMFGVQVDRWVRPRQRGEGDDPVFVLDEEGFLPDPGGSGSGELVRPQEAARQGALVLLGEPGAGKTTTFTALTGANPLTPSPVPGGSGTVWVTGSDLTDAGFQGLLGDYLAALPLVGQVSEVGGELVVVIDQLDEHPARRTLVRRLERALAGRDTRRLRVFVACRTAEYPERLTEVLQKALGGCAVGDLAPLTRADASTLVSSTGVDAEEFLDAVVDNQAGVLAGVPLTLRVLLAAYRRDAASLSQGPRALFELGVRALADEPDPDRPAPTTSVDQRVAIASRIATHLLLCGRRTLWAGPAASARPDEVTDGMLSGGVETAGLGVFDVTPLAVDETLRTALFSRSGADRVAFAHSSFAAFLAARYLAARLQGPMPTTDEPQLAGVFLVSAPDEDTATVPEHLRETAAWLLAHAPTEARWLVLADPEGLVAYSSYITSPDSRTVLVDGLLNLAERIELTNRSWQRARWRLAHPGLAEQLRGILEPAATNPSAEWADLARVRLAVRLAHDSSLECVAGSLVRLAEAPGWPVALRQSAATAAVGTSPSLAIPRLRALLTSLAPAAGVSDRSHDDDADESERDNGVWDDNEELVGTLLSLLWPAHLPLAEALPHIRPIPTRMMLGVYRWQVAQFARGVREDELATLITFAADVLRKYGALNQHDHADDEDPAETSPQTRQRNGRADTRTLRDFVSPIIDRVLLSAHAHEHLPALVRVLVWFLRASDGLPMPIAADLIDEHGHEPGPTQGLRHGLAEALIRHFFEQFGKFDRYSAFVITSHWRPSVSPFGADRDTPPGLLRAGRSRLLEDADLVWALCRADHHRGEGNSLLADAFGQIAETIGNLYNPTTFELVYSRRGTPEWECFRWAYDGVPLAGPLAEAMRRNNPTAQPWEEADAFADLQHQRLDAATDGDPKAFWALIRDLRVDPITGHYQHTSSWDVDSFPGAVMWPGEVLHDRLLVAARRYLCAEHDHRDTWLGTTTLDYRADAGFIALTILHRAGEPNGLDSVPPQRWAAWVGTIVDNVHRDADTGATLIRDLMHQVAHHAVIELSDAVGQLVRTWLARGERPWNLTYLAEVIDAVTAPTLLTDLATEIRTALLHPTGHDTADTNPDQAMVTRGPVRLPATTPARDAAIATWAILLHRPLVAADATALHDAHQALSERDNYPIPDTARHLAVAAGRALLIADAADHWPSLHAKITTSDEFDQDLARVCAEATAQTTAIAETLPDRALVEAYQWLAAVCPPDTEVYQPGFSMVTAEHSIHRWRNTLLTTLAGRGTADAVYGIRQLVAAFPDVLGIQAAMLTARRRAQATAATLLRPRDVNTLLNDPDRRVVRTAVQLAHLVSDTLARVAADLHTHSNLLWDCERGTRFTDAPSRTQRPESWRPKPEGSLAAYLAHELRLRLERRPVVVNREVVVHPTDAGDSGHRPDIVIVATSPNPNNPLEAHTLSIPIEIKGSWHEAVLTAQEAQLAALYIPEMHTDTGIYLVGWYPLDQWTVTGDRRKTNASKLGSPEQLISSLQQQADTIHANTTLRTFPHVITISRAIQQPAANATT